MREACLPETATRPAGADTVAQDCPFEHRCPCRKGSWCRQKREQARREHRAYGMLTLEGCRDGHCEHPCVLLHDVESQANGILAAAGISGPPVPLDLVRRLDPERPVEIRYLPLHAHHGAVWRIGDEWVLHLNENQPLPMARYVAFHEGYHIVCHVSALYEAETADGCRPFTEATADYFAASILMPRQWVLDYWPRVRSINRMAEIFQAPEPAVRAWVRRWVADA